MINDPEAITQDIWHELSRRDRILGAAYPFEVRSSVVEVKPASELTYAYTFMLVLAQDRALQNLKIRDHGYAGRLFEKLVTPAVATYVNGSSVRIGHPREAPTPRSFRKLLVYLGNILSEGTLRSQPLNPDTKDCKADIVAWKSFRDNRGGKIVLFVQCAASSKKRVSKLAELSLPIWSRYIEFTVPPNRGFAVPFIETDEERWLEYGTIGGIAFDRIRLQEMLSHTIVPPNLRAEIERWSQEKLKMLLWDSAS